MSGMDTYGVADGRCAHCGQDIYRVFDEWHDRARGMGWPTCQRGAVAASNGLPVWSGPLPRHEPTLPTTVN